MDALARYETVRREMERMQDSTQPLHYDDEHKRLCIAASIIVLAEAIGEKYGNSNASSNK